MARRNLTDTVVNVFDSVRNDYRMGKANKYKTSIRGISPFGSAADYHYRNEHEFLRTIEYARDYDRNNMVVGQGVSRLIRNILQGGIPVNPDTGSDKLDSVLKSRWDEWSSDPDQCHSSREENLNSLTALALRGEIVDGDHVWLLSDAGHIQPFEAHRLRTPRNTSKNVVHGVLLNDLRERVEYWITKEDIDPNTMLDKVSDVTAYPTRDELGRRRILHLMDPKRVSQTRGVSRFAPIDAAIAMHDDLQFAKMVQQKIVSVIAFIRTRDLMFENAGATPSYGPSGTETLSDGSIQTLEGLSPGIEVRGLPGEKIEGWSPNVPNESFFQHAMMILQFVAINLGLPVQVFLLDATQTNFSGWRGAMDQARVGFIEIQNRVIDKLLRPTYTWKVESWLAEDEGLRRMAGSRKAILPTAHHWQPPWWPYIQPEVDAKADGVIVEKGLNSRRNVLSRRGLDIDIIDRQQIADQRRRIEMAIEAADGIKQSFPDAAVTWRDLIATEVVADPMQPAMEPDPNAPVV